MVKPKPVKTVHPVFIRYWNPVQHRFEQVHVVAVGFEPTPFPFTRAF